MKGKTKGNVRGENNKKKWSGVKQVRIRCEGRM